MVSHALTRGGLGSEYRLEGPSSGMPAIQPFEIYGASKCACWAAAMAALWLPSLRRGQESLASGRRLLSGSTDSRLELGGQSYTIGTWIESFGSAGPKPDLESHGQSDARLHPYLLKLSQRVCCGTSRPVPGALV